MVSIVLQMSHHSKQQWEAFWYEIQSKLASTEIALNWRMRWQLRFFHCSGRSIQQGSLKKSPRIMTVWGKKIWRDFARTWTPTACHFQEQILANDVYTSLILAYIAGFVVYKLGKNLTCITCSEALSCGQISNVEVRHSSLLLGGL